MEFFTPFWVIFACAWWWFVIPFIPIDFKCLVVMNETHLLWVCLLCLDVKIEFNFNDPNALYVYPSCSPLRICREIDVVIG